jgi:hypothetical protein
MLLDDGMTHKVHISFGRTSCGLQPEVISGLAKPILASKSCTLRELHFIVSEDGAAKCHRSDQQVIGADRSARTFKLGGSKP